MRPLTRQLKRALPDIAAVPRIRHGARPRIERGDGGAKRLEIVAYEVDAIAMRRRGDANDVVRVPA